MIRALFRTNGDHQTGLGHIRRCLTLAQALRRDGVASDFLVDGSTALLNLVQAQGFEALQRTAKEDVAETTALCRDRGCRILVADSYALAPDYFRNVAAAGVQLTALDDLADRELPVRVVVNGTAGAEQLPYRGLPDTLYLLGPRYMLLRSEFSEDPQRTIVTSAHRILVTLGGSDPYNLTVRLVEWISTTLPGVEVDVVIGPLFANVPDIQAVAQKYPARLHLDPPDIRTLMLQSDVAVSAGGQSTYELAATGTPTLAIRTAANQAFNLTGLAAAGCLRLVGEAGAPDLRAALENQLVALVADPGRRLDMSRRGRALVDGLGAERVSRQLLEDLQVLA